MDKNPLLLILLPGMDGTGRLFGRLQAELAPDFDTQVIAYPSDEPLNYDALTRRVAESLPQNRRFAIVAESFSGPIAIRLAAQQSNLAALVLASSFTCCPRPGLKKLPGVAWLAPFFSWFASPWWVRRTLLLPESSNALVDEVVAAVRGVRPKVLASRLQEILTIDVTAPFNALTLPVLYLAGHRDRLLPPKMLKAFIPERPNVHPYFLDAPHLVLQTAPAACAALIRKFCTK